MTKNLGIRYAINGFISTTPDSHPAHGESPEERGRWSVAAISEHVSHDGSFAASQPLQPAGSAPIFDPENVRVRS